MQGGSGSFLWASAPHSRLRSSNYGKGAGVATELPPPPRRPSGPHTCQRGHTG